MDQPLSRRVDFMRNLTRYLKEGVRLAEDGERIKIEPHLLDLHLQRCELLAQWISEARAMSDEEWDRAHPPSDSSARHVECDIYER